MGEAEAALPHIQRLDESVVNRIAAGEIIQASLQLHPINLPGCRRRNPPPALCCGVAAEAS